MLIAIKHDLVKITDQDISIFFISSHLDFYSKELKTKNQGK